MITIESAHKKIIRKFNLIKDIVCIIKSMTPYSAGKLNGINTRDRETDMPKIDVLPIVVPNLLNPTESYYVLQQVIVNQEDDSLQIFLDKNMCTLYTLNNQ